MAGRRFGRGTYVPSEPQINPEVATIRTGAWIDPILFLETPPTVETITWIGAHRAHIQQQLADGMRYEHGHRLVMTYMRPIPWVARQDAFSYEEEQVRLVFRVPTTQDMVRAFWNPSPGHESPRVRREGDSIQVASTHTQRVPVAYDGLTPIYGNTPIVQRSDDEEVPF